MAWIKMRTDLLTDPRVMAMADALSQNLVTVVGCCYTLWSQADTHSTSGTLLHMTADRLDRACGVPGFAQAAVDVGWLECNGKSLKIPRFDTHNGESAKARANAAARQKLSRSRVTPVTQASQKSVTREEKRREESKSPLKPPQGGASGNGHKPPSGRRGEYRPQDTDAATIAREVHGTNGTV